MDSRVEAIRENKLIGRGSCSIVDECMSDDEVIVELDQWEVTDPEEAVNHYISIEGLQIEAALNARSGEDDDPELAAADSWNARKAEYKGGESNAPTSVIAAHVGSIR